MAATSACYARSTSPSTASRRAFATAANSGPGSYLFFLQELLELGERPMLRRRRIALLAPAAGSGIDYPRVLVLMAVNAQQFPIGAVRRIVVVVAVLVMHRELAQPLAGELAGAASA